MVVKKEKVLTIPASFRNSGTAFVCSCPVCVDQLLIEREQKAQIENAKGIIEEIFEQTALNAKNFNINVSYSDSASPTKPKKHSEIKASDLATKSILKFTTQFNKKYRHPLVCKLNASAEILKRDIVQYDAIVQFGDLAESRLWKLEEIVNKVEETRQIIRDIKVENLLESEELEFLSQKLEQVTKENKLQLKKSFISALKIPEFEPHCTYDDFHLPYY